MKEKNKQIEERLFFLANKSKQRGEIWRAPYTQSYQKASEIIKNWMKERGLVVYEDAIGNIFGRVAGETSETVLTGSHLDTVKNGGVYDGAMGIVVGIQAIGELIAEKGTPLRSVEVVALIEEEGSRFASSYIGSRGITGKLCKDDFTEKDQKGVTLFDAMKKAGLYPQNFEEAKREDLLAFIELHVEQGPLLEQAGKTIGIVESIVGIYSYEITIAGEQNHAGTTPMGMRKDPVVKLAQFIGDVTKEVRKASFSATFTVGSINTKPGLSNVIAKEVNFEVDLREGVKGSIKAIEKIMNKHLKVIESEGFGIKIEKKCSEEPTELDSGIIAVIEEASKSRGISYIRMNSGAGHDSQIFAEKLPTGMIFVPSKKGISHSPLEHTDWADLNYGKDVLKDVLFKLLYF